MRAIACVAAMVAGLGPAGLCAQDDSQLITSSEPGAVVAAMEARCRVELERRDQNGIQGKFCSAQQFLVISEADMCGLPLGLKQGTPAQWDQFVGSCLPKLLFGQAKVTVGESVFKRKLLEDAGYDYTADHEVLNVTYTIEFCAGHSQYLTGMAYVGSTKGSVYLVTDYPPECLTPSGGE